MKKLLVFAILAIFAASGCADMVLHPVTPGAPLTGSSGQAVQIQPTATLPPAPIDAVIPTAIPTLVPATLEPTATLIVPSPAPTLIPTLVPTLAQGALQVILDATAIQATVNSMVSAQVAEAFATVTQQAAEANLPATRLAQVMETQNALTSGRQATQPTPTVTITSNPLEDQLKIAATQRAIDALATQSLLNQVTSTPPPFAATIRAVQTQQSQPAPTVAPVTPAPQNEPMLDLQLAPYVDGVDVNGVRFQRILGTYMALDLSQGRYGSKTPVQPVKLPDGTFKWCQPENITCPPHVFLISAQAPMVVTGLMDVSYRMFFTNHDANNPQPVHLRMVFDTNGDLPQGKTLESEYRVMAQGLNAASTNSDLGLFFMTKDAGVQPAVLQYLQQTIQFGGGCYDCLANTRGANATMSLPVDDPSMFRFGTPTAPTGSSMFVGRVISIPHPSENSAWSLDVTVMIPPGEQIVIFTGVYDVNKADQALTNPTATLLPSMGG